MEKKAEALGSKVSPKVPQQEGPEPGTAKSTPKAHDSPANRVCSAARLRPRAPPQGALWGPRVGGFLSEATAQRGGTRPAQPPARVLMALGPWDWAPFMGQEPGAAFQGLSSSWDEVLFISAHSSTKAGGQHGGNSCFSGQLWPAASSTSQLVRVGDGRWGVAAGRHWGWLTLGSNAAMPPQRTGRAWHQVQIMSEPLDPTESWEGPRGCGVKEGLGSDPACVALSGSLTSEPWLSSVGIRACPRLPWPLGRLACGTWLLVAPRLDGWHLRVCSVWSSATTG